MPRWSLRSVPLPAAARGGSGSADRTRGERDESGGELRFDRDQVWIVHRGVEVARYPRSYEAGVWLPPPIMRAEPPIASPPAVLPRLAIAQLELADHAELCA